MAADHITIPVKLNDGNTVGFTVYPESDYETALQLIDAADAAEAGEAALQLLEGFSYEYEISAGYQLEAVSKIVSRSRLGGSSGRIMPNTFVGTLFLDIIEAGTSEKKGTVAIEVRSVKTTYRQDYRFMLEEIARKCTDLLLQHNSPAMQRLTTDYTKDTATLYQQYAFIRSVIEAPDFQEAVHRVLADPVTAWEQTTVIKDIRSSKRVSGQSVRQLLTAKERIPLHTGHSLQARFGSLPARLELKSKHETFDTPENRFIKHALSTFLRFFSDVRDRFEKGSRARKEAAQSEMLMSGMLAHDVFKGLQSPGTLMLNSPVLQRKEGYREILRVWLMFDLAARLAWNGGDDVYYAGKRNIAVLYEYWVFFKLLELCQDMFRMHPADISELIEPTQEGLGLKLKSGRSLKFAGYYDSAGTRLNVRFSYNRTFKGNKVYPAGGSWTVDMRPDYSLSLWPEDLTQEDAETTDKIVHIHFDAKYRISGLADITEITDEESGEITENIDYALYKRDDLLKMHAYKDAIRRTSGTYVLYPGTEIMTRKEFHEIIPGLGAFPLRPSALDNGLPEIRKFITDVLSHLPAAAGGAAV
jgi:predicted component of viral defense system (DUF524 family)